ncbi:type II secretion system protein [bacterium]|jgi:prepilin-type N-terminal cleavage/methylation domain-containing protein|nr:type II secretion system protein [bacterium]MBT3729916.1 type II secretion system protein [bacterium]MBT4894882.1 type II secretion system protein [bacterium]
MKRNLRKTKNRGFTLIEALVAIAILTISIAGPITIASRGLASAVFARDQITAFYLAQEAVEFIRNKRDGNNLEDNPWTDGLTGCLDGKVCTIDSKNNEINECIGGTCPVLKYDDSTAFYSYDSGDDSNFTREVRMTTINVKEIAITTTLSWSSGSITKSFTVKEHILDW